MGRRRNPWLNRTKSLPADVRLHIGSAHLPMRQLAHIAERLTYRCRPPITRLRYSGGIRQAIATIMLPAISYSSQDAAAPNRCSVEHFPIGDKDPEYRHYDQSQSALTALPYLMATKALDLRRRLLRTSRPPAPIATAPAPAMPATSAPVTGRPVPAGAAAPVTVSVAEPVSP